MYEYLAVVERVVDGDTAVLQVDLGFHTWHVGNFRLLGAAARELRQPGGVEARNHLMQLLPIGTQVRIRSVKDDKYGGRYDAAVTLSDGRDLVMLLVGEHWAAPWNGRGPTPVPPWPRPETGGT